MEVDVTRPDLLLMKDGKEVSKHRDTAEAAAKAVSMGPGEYALVQPPIMISVKA